MERAAVLSPGPSLQPSDLPNEIHQSQTDGNYFIIPFGTTLDKMEQIVIRETLRRTGGDKKLTAQLLGIATRTIYRKIDSFQQDESSQPESSQPASSENDPPPPGLTLEQESTGTNL